MTNQNVVLSAKLKSAVDAFSEYNDLALACRTQAGAFGKCGDVSESFIMHTLAYGFEPYIVCLQTKSIVAKEAFPNAHERWLSWNYHFMTHYIVKIEDVYIDWSYRQFDPDGGLPAFFTYDCLFGDLFSIWQLEGEYQRF